MSQRYDINTKRTNPKENQPGIQKFYAFCQKIQPRASGSGESAAGVTYLSVRTHAKSCRIFPLKVAATFLVIQGRVRLEHSSHVVKVGVEATC